MALPLAVRHLLATTLTGVLAVPVALVGPGSGQAVAEPRAKLAQVQRQVDSLNHQAEQAAERFNTARVELTETTRRLKAVRGRFERQRQAFEATRLLVGRIAAATYKNGTVDPAIAMLLSDNPTTFLREAANLAQVGHQQSAMLRKMATARLRLAQDRRAVRQERARAIQLQRDIAAERRSVESRLAKARRLLDSLRAADRARLEAQRQAAQERAVGVRSDVQRASRSARPGNFPTYDGPASGRAAVALETAYDQLGDPYAWGAAGPGSFDCSGLTMFSWASAGVSLPHSSAAQFSAVRRISVDDLQPGDLVFYYSPISHVAMYVGGGQVIDAPYPGLSVHITGLYSMPLVGAGRP